MSIILALLTAAILIGAGLLRTRKPKERVTPALVERYVHPGHAWIRETDDGDLLLGVDDFAQSVVGSIDRLVLPKLLRSVRQGQPAVQICHGGRSIPVVSPVNGRVVEKNEMALRNPSLVNTSPYGDGWLLRIRPSARTSTLTGLLTGKAAKQWQASRREALVRFFSATPALMYQDGGALIQDLSDKCSDQEWDALVKEFFLVDPASTR